MVINNMKTLLILFSYHHNNTEKVAKVFASVLEAQIKTPQEVNPEELKNYNLIGFGSGIYGGRHHKSLIELIDTLPQVKDRKAFIFSTDGAPRRLIKYDPSYNEKILLNNHACLKEKLQLKGYMIADEFNCGGFNTNKFLKLFGGINKGRPNTKDLKHAEEFAQNLKQKL